MKYYLFTNLAQYDEPTILHCLEQMPLEQVERINQVHHLQGKREKVIAWQLLTQALNEFGINTPPQIAYNPHGKPFFKDYPTLHFNISHCKTAVAIAINQHQPIGIDVESKRKISESLIKKVCNPLEQNEIALSLDPTLTFIRIWTRKEAYYKCIGTGIQDNFYEVESLIAQQNLHIESHPLPNNEGYFSICY